MTSKLPKIGQRLSTKNIKLLEAIAKNCRKSILQMVVNAQSGHPGGSLSTIDYLTLIYTLLINQTNDPVIVSNGHISPAVYAVLGELSATNKQNAINNFRKSNDVYEGHINRHVNGVWYGTGPLAIGGSVATGIAHALKLQHESKKVFLVMGDGESQEGQTYEMMHYANKYKLNNLILFIDYNKVQLTDSLKKIMPINLKGHYQAAGWEVLEADGHNFSKLWKTLAKAYKSKKPVCILGHTIMGKGIPLMEKTGKAHKSTWHGKSPDPQTGQKLIDAIKLTSKQEDLIKEFRKTHKTKIKTTPPEKYKHLKVNPGKPQTYSADTLIDCRSAYGNALKDLANKNKHLVALTADVSGSDKTKSVQEVDPARHIDVGIAEQHMVSCSGGLSVSGIIPFCSTFGAFMTSRAKDQARVNDINHANVKMVATHCGLSVGEDGPTHQSIDDIGSFSGFFNTIILEPADPNQTDHIIRYIAKTDGNFYVRMGRAKIPTITKTDGTPFFDAKYKFKPGKADIIRTGKKVTIVASGPMVQFALKATAQLPKNTVEIITISSFTPFDHKTVTDSLKKTGKVIIASDHHYQIGLGSLVKQTIADAGLKVKIVNLGVKKYQLSGTADQLYRKAGIDSGNILKRCKELMG